MKPFYDTFKEIFHASYPSLEFDNMAYATCWLMTILILGAGILILSLIIDGIYHTVDSRKASYQVLTGHLIDKRYKGESSSTGTATTVVPMAGGGVGVGISSTRSYSPEDFLFFVKTDVVRKISVNMQQFYAKNIGDTVEFKVKIGYLTNKELKTTLND